MARADVCHPDRAAILGRGVAVRATGSRGLHVVAPLDRSAGFDEARSFARELAALLAEGEPERFTVEQRKNKRRGRLYVDTARNAYAQTAVTPMQYVRFRALPSPCRSTGASSAAPTRSGSTFATSTGGWRESGTLGEDVAGRPRAERAATPARRASPLTRFPRRSPGRPDRADARADFRLLPPSRPGGMRAGHRSSMSTRPTTPSFAISKIARSVTPSRAQIPPSARFVPSSRARGPCPGSRGVGRSSVGSAARSRCPRAGDRSAIFDHDECRDLGDLELLDFRSCREYGNHGRTAVIRWAEARRAASIIRRSSMRWSFTGREHDWTRKTSAPRIDSL
jgi:hypothetical protein